MTGLDLSPRGTAARRGSRIWRHALIETSLVVRNGEQLLLALVIPLALILAQPLFGQRLGIAPEPFVASVLALGLWSSGFTSPAITTAFERRYGVLERLVATPLRRADLLAGKAAMIAIVALGQAAVLAVAGLASGWRPTPALAQTGVVLIAVPLALAAFAAWALCLAGVASAELALAVANLIYLAGAGFGVVVPLTSLPGWAQPVAAALPASALAECLRAWAVGDVAAWPLLVLLTWVVAGLALARKVFRWTS